MNTQTQRRHKRRDKWRAANGPCAHCGSWDDLQVDHIDPATKHEALKRPRGKRRSIWSFSATDLERELMLCQALCESCHLLKTAHERRPQPRHGTIGEYTNHHCRCVECRAANAATQRRYIDKRRLAGNPVPRYRAA